MTPERGWSLGPAGGREDCGEVTFHNDILWCFITEISDTEEACCEVNSRFCLGTRTPGVWRTNEDAM